MKKQSIINELKSTVGGSESSSVTLITDLTTGESELVVEKSFREYFPVTKYEEVMELHKNLNRGGGRTSHSLKDLTK